MDENIYLQKEDTDKKENDTDSEKSNSNSENDDYQSECEESSNYTTVENLKTYFNFFHHRFGKDFKEKYFDSKDAFIQHQIIQVFEKQSSEKDLESTFVKNATSSTSLDKKAFESIEAFQQSHRIGLEQKLLSSGRFKKAESFKTELLIHEVESSKHCEIVKLQIHFLWYKTEILILNDIEKSPFGSVVQASNSGAFGMVYFVKALNEELAIKCLSMSTKEKDRNHCKNIIHSNKIIIDAIKEFFFLLLFSELEIGPKVKTIGGFDMILNKDYAEFATEICLTPKKEDEEKLKKDISQSLFEMHMLQIVHRDIKPSNIMYSPTFKKHVFIDFGCSEGLKESLGKKKVTKFTGATAFCSNEMLSLLSLKVGFVDLYFNDVFSFNKSLKFQYFESPKEYKINKLSNPVFEIIALKFNLFKKNYNAVNLLWNQVRKQHYSEIDDLQMKLLSFFKDLRMTSELRDFYKKEIDEINKEMPEFKLLNTIMKDPSFHQISEIMDFPEKQEEFSSFEKLYQILKIECGDLTKEETEISNILLSKEKITVFLSEIEMKLEKGHDFEADSFEAIKLSVIVAFYATYAENKYEASTEDKVKACILAIEVLERSILNKSGREQSYEKFFKQGIKEFHEISCFYKIFWFWVWNFVPEYFRDKSALNSMITLSMINPPISITMLVSCLLKSESWPSEVNKMFLEQNKTSLKSFESGRKTDCEEKKLKLVCLFWEFHLVHLLFHDTVFTINENHSQTDPELEILIKTELKRQEEWMNVDHEDKIFEINKEFYKELISNYEKFDFPKIKLLLEQMEDVKILEYEEEKFFVRKWKFLIKLIVFSHEVTYLATTPKELSIILCNEPFLCQHYKENLLLYQIYLYFYKTINLDAEQFLFSKVYEILNEIELSQKYCLSDKLSLWFKREDLSLLNNTAQLIRREINLSSFHIEDNEILIKMAKKIEEIIVSEVEKCSFLSEELIKLLKGCYEFIDLCWEIAINDKESKPIESFNQSESINPIIILNYVKKKKLKRTFYTAIFILGRIYKTIITYLNNQQSKKFPESLHQKNFIFILKILKKLRKIGWFEEIIEFPEIKEKLKENPLILNSFVNFYCSQFRTTEEYYKSSELISYFYENFKPEDFSKSEKNLSVPLLNIGLFYSSIKLTESDYNPEEGENLIKLYKISVKQNTFETIIDRRGLIRNIFLAFIYAEKPFEELFDYFKQLSLCQFRIHKSSTIKIFIEETKYWLWDRSLNVFPKEPEKWNPSKFAEFLSDNINLLNPKENPYMAVIYIHSINIYKIESKIVQKFIGYILKSMKYLEPFVRRHVSNLIYYCAYEDFYKHEKTALFTQNEINNFYRVEFDCVEKYKGLKKFSDPKLERFEREKRISKSERHLTIHRRFFRNLILREKHEITLNKRMDELPRNLLFKETYFYDYKYPPRIKEIYLKKWKRFYEVKESFSKDELMREVFLTNMNPFREEPTSPTIDFSKKVKMLQTDDIDD